ncbi:hypothetical protein Pla8534_45930 [Lignipirellula cremea]|uniref:Uncharacterized protein n=2 Tax=Lignipirellula cremea TaxID=2528010 RepID=A0A518DY48_9BACT|nr:hypothetical protein Pla8534_45930 [Lignipirellula cremea]
MVAGGAGFALLSGHPDIVGALLMAVEVAYLGLLGTNPHFQKYVDAQAHAESRGQISDTQEQTVKKIMRALPRPALERFEQLRTRCFELRQIADNLKNPNSIAIDSSLESMQWEGFDRLLWVFLRLLYTHYSLSTFLERTDADAIADDIKRLEHRLLDLESADPSPHTAKMAHTLEDNLKTCRERMANYRKAEANHEFVELEIDRLANKIKTLAELAVNRQEHDFITSQVDAVANSMVETERTMNELDFATGLAQYNTDTPQLLPQPVKIIE